MDGDGASGDDATSWRYDAFLSYAHADDVEGLVRTLQDTLAHIGKPWYRRSALRVFRDETGLSANPGLWSSITDAMDASRWLIVVASPAGAASEWVDREIARWIEQRGTAQILPVVVGGTWAWDDASGGFDPAASDAVAPSLRHAFAEEPRHIDLTWAAAERDLSRRSPRWRDQVAELAAPIHGVSKEDLTGTDLREHRRTLRIARAAVVVLTVLALAAGSAAVVAIRKARESREQQHAAESARQDAEYRRLIAQSRDLRRSDRQLALLLGVEARHIRETPEANGAIQAAILEDPRLLTTTTESAVADDGYWQACGIPGSERAITGGNDGTVGILDLRSGKAGPRHRLLPSSLRPSDTGARSSSVLCDAASGRAGVVASASGSVWSIDARTLETGAERDAGAEIGQVAASPDGRWIAAGTVDGRAVVWRTSGGPPVADLHESDAQSAVGVAFSPDGSTLLTTSRSALRYHQVGSWALRSEAPSEQGSQGGGLVDLPELVRSVQFDPSGSLILDSRRAVIRMHDARTGRVLWSAENNYVTTADLTFDHEGDTVFIIDDGGNYTRVDARSGARVGERIKPTDGTAFPVLDPGITDVLPLVSEVRGTLERWALDGRSPISIVLEGGSGAPESASRDGRSVAVVPPDASVVGAGEVFDTTTGDRRGSFTDAAFPTMIGRGTVGGFFLEKLAVDRWDLRRRRFIGPSYTVEIAGVVQADVSPDGEVVIGYQDGTILRYDRNGHEVGHPFAHLDDVGAVRVHISADARYVGVTNSSRDGMLLDGRTGRLLRRFHGDLSSTSTARGLVGVFPSAGILDLRSLKTGRLVHRLEVASTAVDAEIELPAYLFATDTREMQLYDWTTLRPVGDPFTSTSTPLPLGDGRRLATSTDEHVVIWDLDPDRWEEAACEMAGRSLTSKEREQYLPPGTGTTPTCPGSGG